MRVLALALILSLLPATAWASGFHVPWWIEVILFFTTPAGWVTLLAIAVAVTLLFKASK